MSNIEIFPLFASNVILSTIEEDINLIEEVKKYKFRNCIVEGNVTKNFISENRRILDDLHELKSIILDHFNNIKDNILMFNDTKFEVTTSWFTKFSKGSSCHYHSHMNCMFSGILYFGEYDENCGVLEFETPMISNQILVKPTEYNIVNSNVMSFHPADYEKNTIIFFPSYLRHRVATHLSDIDRYSLAFNLMPTGKFGAGDSSIDIKLN